MNMTDISNKANKLAIARHLLATLAQSLNADIEELKRDYMAQIKKAVARVAIDHEDLRAALEASPELFDKPRTQVFSGIKVGFRKGSGGIDWDDDEKVAALVQKHFADQFDVLIKTTHKPIKKALEQLDVSDLKKVGCRVEATGDVVVIKPIDSAVDKAVAALLKGATEEAQKEAA
jgi:hypothetical protein